MTDRLAIVGMGCQYPDARSCTELWENVLAQRRAFRRLPAERFRLEDYYSADRNAPDRTYSTQAALIEGYEFDRLRFRVVGSTFRSADTTHWLALDVAATALEDAGFADAEGLPRESTAVIVGNTLTGEFSRANVMRLRWPYVRRVVLSALKDRDWSAEDRHRFLKALEENYKAPFPSIGEESLAGGLSNTIAGRICNHFDLKGGGYTVDGACSSSLLAITHACGALLAGDVDIVLAGGVDLSLDPFEMVGFAKTNALAVDEMRVYDARSAGFWPGEGCGFVVLMRAEQAIEQKRRIYAFIRGWGISSDGSGGLTRPEEEGQLLALQRAYRRAGLSIGAVPFFEGHGTGTAIGDATELRVLSRARREADNGAPPAAIGSIKANFGHTKAAAGVAGLIKATLALHEQVLPPTTGCEVVNAELAGQSPALRILRRPESWPADKPLWAGVSAMGFGGINTHVVLEGVATKRRTALSPQVRKLQHSYQDAELFLLTASSRSELSARIDGLTPVAAGMARSQLADLAVSLAGEKASGFVRAAVVASRPAELADGLKQLKSWIDEDVTSRIDPGSGVFLGNGEKPPRIGFLFPGQGSPAHLDGGALRQRFKEVEALYQHASLPVGADGIATEVAQPAIVTASAAAMGVLEALGISASVAVGHSLGELTALHWAGALDAGALLRVASARGKAMAELGSPTGAMAGIGADARAVEALLEESVLSSGDSAKAVVVIAGINSPRQTVISGSDEAVAEVMANAKRRGLSATRLPVSHAFHSSLVAAATPALRTRLAGESFQPLKRTVVSSIAGDVVSANEDLSALLCRQITSPVRFIDAVTIAARDLDLMIEVGPGQVLSGLVGDFIKTPVVATDAGGASVAGILRAVAAAFVLGARVQSDALFKDRFTRPFDVDRRPRFFQSPCELAPIDDGQLEADDIDSSIEQEAGKDLDTRSTGLAVGSPLELVRQLVADRAELPPSAVKDDNRLLSDLHLNSISVGQIVVEAARHLDLPPPIDPTAFANATVAEVARALEEWSEQVGDTTRAQHEQLPSGVDGWIRCFAMQWTERSLIRRRQHEESADWQVLASPGHPLQSSLKEVFSRSAQGGGVVVCLPPEPNEQHLGLLLAGANAVLTGQGVTRFVMVQHGGGAASFAKTLHLEKPNIHVCVVDVPIDHPQAVDWVLAEANNVIGYSEAHYDTAGRRRVPGLGLVELDHGPEHWPLGPDDVLLISGGGKGIAVECGMMVARETGVRLALLGRTAPEDSDELANNLKEMASAGIEHQYLTADVTDAASVRRAVEQIESKWGPVTAFWHAAGVNQPQLLETLDEEAFLQTLAPKLQGVKNVLAALTGDRLNLFVSFGSIIAQSGLSGEADYAVANEWLARFTEQWQADHPHCQCLAIEWSVWAAIGMGHRLGRVEALKQRGVTPIPTDEGLRWLRRLVCRPPSMTSVTVTGRYGRPPTLDMLDEELPLRRFLEKPTVHYPGVELVVDINLSVDTDPYVNDHVLHGERLFPAVMALEAMAQVAAALGTMDAPPLFNDLRLMQAVVVPEKESVTIRIAALQRQPGRVDVVLRCSVTGFQVDHYSATCHLDRTEYPIEPASMPIQDDAQDPIGIKPDQDLYGRILFHTGRFQRLADYHRLSARECLAEIAPATPCDWFGPYLPAALVLGDPACRDAAIHAIQSCIPHARLVPVGVDRIVPADLAASEPHFVRAIEVARDGDTFTYDMEIADAGGRVIEKWHGLQLQMLERISLDGRWNAALLGPYTERRVNELISGASVSVAAVQDDSPDRREQSDRAIRRALGTSTVVSRRSDGKPYAGNGCTVSSSHADCLTLAVAGTGALGCDLEPVTGRSTSVWQDMLGPERYSLADVVAGECGEDTSTSATRVWAAGECLKKAGATLGAPLVFVDSTADGWVLFRSGILLVATSVTTTSQCEGPFVVAVLAESNVQSI